MVQGRLLYSRIWRPSIVNTFNRGPTLIQAPSCPL
jgi:hypothetical protein